MNFKLFGLKIDVVNAVIFLVLGFLVSTLTVCSCAKVHNVKEAMDVIKGDDKKMDEDTTNLDESMSDDVVPMGMSKDMDTHDLMGDQMPGQMHLDKKMM